MNYEDMAIHMKELEKALFSSIQLNLKIIKYYNSLYSQIKQNNNYLEIRGCPDALIFFKTLSILLYIQDIFRRFSK